MKLDYVKGQVRKLSERLNYMVVVSLGLLVSNIFLALLSGYALLHQKRLITPFYANTHYEVSDSTVDPSYLDLMSIDLVDTRLSVSPETVRQNYHQLLSYVSTGQHAIFLAQLNGEAEEIEKSKTSSVFYREDIHSNASTLTTIITGTLKRWVGFRELKPVKKIYRLQYQYYLGRLTLKSFTEEKPHE